METLSGLLGRQQRALVEAAEHARCLESQLSALALHRSAAPQSGTIGVEQVDDPERVRALLDSVAAVASRRIRIIQPSVVARHLIADWLSGTGHGRDEGVEIRTIHQSSLLQSERAADYLEWLARRGVLVRVAPLLPFRLILVDETFALVCQPETTLLVREPVLLQLLCRVFEFCWDDARDLRRPPAAESVPERAGPAGTPGQAAGPALSEQQLVILRLWAKGRHDNDIARELQISPRTLRRLVSALLRRLGVGSRFEAGVVAARTQQLRDIEPRLSATP